MSLDEELGYSKAVNIDEKQFGHRSSTQRVYNNEYLTQDNSILSKLRRFEAKLDAKLVLNQKP